MAEFKNFTFKNVSVIFGIIEFTGFAEGDDVVVIEVENNLFNKVVGAKGDVTRTQSTDTSGSVTVKLLQTSSTNALLNAAYLADLSTGSAVAPMAITDLESGEIYSMPNAWIVKFPTVTRGQNPNSMDWVFEFDQLIPVITE